MQIRQKMSVAIVLCGSLIQAAPGYAETDEFALERFRWATRAGGILDVESGEVAPAGRLTVGLWGGYANDPLVLEADGTRLGSLVHHRVGGTMMAAWSLGLLDVAVEVPWIAYQTRPTSDLALSQLRKGALGDVRLAPKLRLLRAAQAGLDVALQVGVGLPTGPGGYAGNHGVTVEPELLLSRRWAGLRLAAGLGYVVRPRQTLGNLVVDDEATARVGVAVPVGPLEVQASVLAATSAKQWFDQTNQTPTEAKLGVVVPLGPVDALVAGGAGLHAGYGTPDWRLLAGLRWAGGGATSPAAAAAKAPGVRDADNDGVPDNVDGCGAAAEDRDGFQDVDGCPDADNDHDGLSDGDDKCPNEAEVVNGREDADGCPDEADRDNDGRVDSADKCPEEAEDVDGFQDEDGCPDPDNDNDGVPDATDRCALEPGVAENAGCPDKDGDGDGVVDRLDNCPTEPGTAKQFGCAAKQLVTVRDGKIDILEQVFFDTNRATIKRRSYRLLDNVATVLAAHPELHIEVQGHTDDRGNDQANLDLSARRAAAVVEYLVSRDIAAERLVSKGYGETAPLESNQSSRGRAKNRRVVFLIVTK